MKKPEKLLIKIRRIKEQDFEVYQKIRLLTLKTDPQNFSSDLKMRSKQNAKQIKKEISKKVIFGAFQADNLVGIAGWQRYLFPKRKHQAKIVGVYVRPEIRVKGVAGKLMKKLFTEAKKCRIEMLVLQVTANNKIAIVFYGALGFKIFGIETKAVKDSKKYFDMIYMQKFL
jgi:ribosomal protein S18 acetylase RimI-like enzyme